MSHHFFLSETVIIFGMAVLVGWLFRMLRAPSVMGYLIAGMAIGPWGWRLVSATDVGPFSEIGLVLLLFTVGLELSPKPLIRSGWRLVMVTLLQIVTTAAAAGVVLRIFANLSLLATGILGVAVALSSTAIVLKQMSDRGETGSSKGVIITGILLLQDVLVIGLMLLMSLASGDAAASGSSPALRAGLGLAGLAGIIVFARRMLPALLDQVARYGGRELITLFAVLMACGGAWLAAAIGWSPALGACIAGLLLAGADQRRQLVAEITPFQDVFNALFFVSLGMLVNLDVTLRHLPLLAAAILVTLAVKSVLTGAAVLAARWPVRIAVQVGVGLCTLSEFSYVLAHQAAQIHVLPESSLSLLIPYAVGTMMLGALLYPLAGPLSVRLAARAGVKAPPAPSVDAADGTGSFKNHVVLVGYGFTGANLARMLKATRVPYCVIEMNHSLVRQARRDEAPVIVGDATRRTILEHAGLAAARALVIAINDEEATRRIVAQTSARRPELYVLARTHTAVGIDRLYQLGAKLVVPEDFETSVEIAAHVLKQFGIPDNIVEAQIAAIRAGGYGMLRGKAVDRAAHAELIKILERTATQTFYLAEDSHACGVTLAQLNLRAQTGCMVIAVVRAGQPTTNPPPDFLLQANDVIVLVGAHVQIEAAKALLSVAKE